jgi:prevent-host-death family protein
MSTTLFKCAMLPILTSRIDWMIGKQMREVQASEAKTHLPQLLDAVERGETIVITRHGRAIARIVPEAHLRQEEIDSAIESIKGLRTRTGKITVEDLLSARHEGHRY